MDLVNWSYVFTCIPELIPSFFKVTMVCVLVTLVVGSFFGFLLAICKLGRNKVVSHIAYAVTDVIRSVPFLVLLFLLYYALPQLFPGLNNYSKIFFLELSLIVFASCRLSEIMRSAYEAIDHNQMEASLSVGLSPVQALFHIIVPQAFHIALPNLGNLLVGMVLETALGFTIGVYDMMGMAKLINAREYGAHNLEIYLGAALIYWAISLIISGITSWLEKLDKSNQHKRTPVRLASKEEQRSEY